MELYKNKAECCGCMACLESCSKNAISIEADEWGFVFPKINKELCVKCGKCIKVCSFKNNVNLNKTISAYAAFNKSKNILKSSSGGVFIAIATSFIKNGGVVVGCGWDEEFKAEHTIIDRIEELYKLQGSKYVQSNQKDCYKKVRDILEKNKSVLYSGTPCQIAGLKEFLGRNYKLLYTIDLICHGVPSEKFHTSYIKFMEKKLDGKIIGMNYREKSNGWSLRLRCDYLKQGRKKTKRYEYSASYYYNYFEKGLIFRDSCYKCKFATNNRIGDITLGDYWGVEKYHKKLDTYNGISAVLVNTNKGEEILNKNDEIILINTELKNIISENGNLKGPSKCCSEERNRIFDLWTEYGSEGIYNNYKISVKQKIRNFIVMNTPYYLKSRIKKCFYK